jgi:hypothetical protein
LKNLPAAAKHVFAIGSIYSGHMRNVSECHLSIRKTATGSKIVDANMANLTEGGIIFGHIAKNSQGNWELKNISIPKSGRSYEAFVPTCQAYLRNPSQFAGNGTAVASATIDGSVIVGMSFWQRVKQFLFG